ncbi:ABC transporter substrate-binding protein [Cohnella fermenti]|uniref:ABC transporter substrate-binding protein n=1 Tax=Cohnella fermenti TaxID=2565925 RepID=A0A4S4BKY2_9BACL|nr:ABC transporter substrate-binding protein [Cohnella fermenti]THF72878.1 ABC transporter substrate-binding protein [Cohnella fermenti]
MNKNGGFRLNRLTNRIVSFALVASMIGVLSACGGNDNSNSASSSSSAAGGKQVSISFWNTFTGSDADTLKEIVNDYNKANEGKYEVKMDIMPADQFGQKLPPSIATGTAPSLVALSSSGAAAYIQNGSIEPVDDFYSVDGVNRDDFEESAVKLGESNGSLYLLPMQVFGIEFFWNKDLFKAAGLDPDTPPATFEQLADYAVKLTDESKGQYGFAMPIKGAPQYSLMFIWGNGGDVVDLASRKSVLNSAENVETFKWLADLAVQKKVTPKGLNGVETDKLFLSGKAAMYITGPWLAAGLKENNINFGVSLPPKGSAAQATIADGIGFAIPKGTSDEQKLAAYDFVKYWNSTEVGKKWSLAIGFPPYLKSVLADPDIQANETIKLMSNFGDAGRTFLPGFVTADRINSDVLFPLLEQIVSGLDPVQGVEKASSSIDDILKSESQ